MQNNLTKLAIKFKATLNKIASSHHELEELLKQALNGNSEAYQVFLDGVEESYPTLISDLRSNGLDYILPILSLLCPAIIKHTMGGAVFRKPFNNLITRIETGETQLGFNTIADLYCSFNINNPYRGTISFHKDYPIVDDKQINKIWQSTENRGFLYPNNDEPIIEVFNSNLYSHYMKPILESYAILKNILVQ